jgi:hypothetical protein
VRRANPASHKPRHDSLEWALRGERSGRKRDEKSPLEICQIAGLDEASRPPCNDHRLATSREQQRWRALLSAGEPNRRLMPICQLLP